MIIKCLVKPDNALHQIFHKKFERKYISYCEKTFHKPYEKITSEDLKNFIENFVRRLYVLKKCFPYSLAYVLFGVLKHPNLNPIKKNVRSFSMIMNRC